MSVQSAITGYEPLLLTATQVARTLQISPRTLWRLLSAEKLPEPLRLGGSTRWRADDVITWIDAGCPETTTMDNDVRRN
jgi:predicted DNA-binding transcriptional regulator AlpA